MILPFTYPPGMYLSRRQSRWYFVYGPQGNASLSTPFGQRSTLNAREVVLLVYVRCIILNVAKTIRAFVCGTVPVSEQVFLSAVLRVSLDHFIFFIVCSVQGALCHPVAKIKRLSHVRTAKNEPAREVIHCAVPGSVGPSWTKNEQTERKAMNSWSSVRETHLVFSSTAVSSERCACERKNPGKAERSRRLFH